MLSRELGWKIFDFGDATLACHDDGTEIWLYDEEQWKTGDDVDDDSVAPVLVYGENIEECLDNALETLLVGQMVGDGLVLDGGPSPQTRSPTTFVSLLPEAMMASKLLTVDKLAGAVADAIAAGTDKRELCRPSDPAEDAVRWRETPLWSVPAGTDVREFRVPPDRCSGDGLVGTDVRRFCAPPDPWKVTVNADGALWLTDLVGLRTTLRLGTIRTDVRCFH